MYNDILNFCFNEVGSEKFFEKDIAFDKLLGRVFNSSYNER